MDKLPTVEAILERQAKAWEMNRRLADRETGAAARKGPWITVSRQLGSGGTELAQRLGQELEWQVFDQEILTTIARHTHTRETVLAQLDERAIGPLIDYIWRVLDPKIPGQVDFLQEMLRVVWGLAQQGNAIIVGRGANWFLDPRYGLRLRIVAPFEARVRYLVDKRRLPASEAERDIRDNDARQEDFVRKVFARDIDDPLGYEMLINMGSTDLETAATVAVAALRLRVRRA